MTTLAGRYHLQEELGCGSSAVVYRAYDAHTRRVCALKVLRPALRRRWGWRHLERELAVVERLRHPHIVPILDHDLRASAPWIAMPWSPAGSVRARLDRCGPAPVEEVLVRGIEMLEALEAAHRAGIVHRDIQPSNLLLFPDGLKVADFGIAGRVGERGLGAAGAIAFIAPECGRGELRPASDLFAVGVVLYVMATDGNPFDLAGDGERSARFQGLPPALRPIVFRATRPDPDARYASAAAMAMALRHAMVDLVPEPGDAAFQGERDACRGGPHRLAGGVTLDRGTP